MKEALVKIAYRDNGGMQLLEVPAAQLRYYKEMGWKLLNEEPPAPKVVAEPEPKAAPEHHVVRKGR